jgi:hypothetical protein
MTYYSIYTDDVLYISSIIASLSKYDSTSGHRNNDGNDDDDDDDDDTKYY